MKPDPHKRCPAVPAEAALHASPSGASRNGSSQGAGAHEELGQVARAITCPGAASPRANSASSSTFYPRETAVSVSFALILFNASR